MKALVPLAAAVAVPGAGAAAAESPRTSPGERGDHSNTVTITLALNP